MTDDNRIRGLRANAIILDDLAEPVSEDVTHGFAPVVSFETEMAIMVVDRYMKRAIDRNMVVHCIENNPMRLISLMKITARRCGSQAEEIHTLFVPEHDRTAWTVDDHGWCRGVTIIWVDELLPFYKNAGGVVPGNSQHIVLGLCGTLNIPLLGAY